MYSKMREPIFYYSEEWCLYLDSQERVLGVGHSLCQPGKGRSFVFSGRSLVFSGASDSVSVVCSGDSGHLVQCATCGCSVPEEVLVIAALFGTQGG